MYAKILVPRPTSRPRDVIHVAGVPRTSSFFFRALPPPCITLNANWRTENGVSLGARLPQMIANVAWPAAATYNRTCPGVHPSLYSSSLTFQTGISGYENDSTWTSCYDSHCTNHCLHLPTTTSFIVMTTIWTALECTLINILECSGIMT